MKHSTEGQMKMNSHRSWGVSGAIINLPSVDHVGKYSFGLTTLPEGLRRGLSTVHFRSHDRRQ